MTNKKFFISKSANMGIRRTVFGMMMMAIFSIAMLSCKEDKPEKEPAPQPKTPVITITTQPANVTETAGSISGSLTVAATVTENATLSYQWYSNTSAVNTGGTVESGATNAKFTIPPTLAAGAYYYFCEVKATDGAAAVRSNAATVTVHAAGGDPEASILEAVIDKLKLNTALSQFIEQLEAIEIDGDVEALTIFAVKNEGMTKSNLKNLTDDELKRHIVVGSYSFDDLTDGLILTSINGESLYIKVIEGKKYINGVEIGEVIKIDGSYVYIVEAKIPVTGAKTVTVGAQQGTIVAGDHPKPVIFPVATKNIADGEYDATVANLPTGVTVQGKVTISNNSGTLTLAGETTTAIYADGSTFTLTLTIDGATSAEFNLIISPGATKSVSVRLQNGTLTAGTPGTVGFEVATTNIANGEYEVTVANLPSGVTVRGKVSIMEISGILTLAGDATTVAGVTSTLTLTIDGVTSIPFTLTISPFIGTKTVTIGAPSGTPLTTGSTGRIDFPVTTEHIADGTTVNVNWYANAAGTTSTSTPAGLSVRGGSVVQNNATIVVIEKTSATAPNAGSYYFKVTIDGIPSDIITLVITEGLPKSVTVDPTSKTISPGTSSLVEFNVTTQNIADGRSGSLVWYNSQNGTSQINPPTWITNAGVTYVSNNAATVYINTSTASVAGTYYFRVVIDATYSDMVSLVVQLPKMVSITGQSGIITAGVGGAATFNINTGNIANGQSGSVTWYSNAAGTNATNAPAWATVAPFSVSNNAAAMSINATSAAAAGVYYFRVNIDVTQSAVATLGVGAVPVAEKFKAGDIYYKAIIPGLTDVEVTNKMYDVNSGIDMQNSYSGVVNVPPTVVYEGVTYTVKGIGGGAFVGSTALTSVTLSAGIEYIAQNAFNSCSLLASVTLPAGLKTIEDWAFMNCSTLGSLHIPASVTDLGIAFRGCANLTLTAEAGGKFSVADGALFESSGGNAQYYLRWVSEKKTGEYVIPNGVVSIERYAIAYGNLTKINIPASVTDLRAFSIYNNQSLTDITVNWTGTIYPTTNTGNPFNGPTNGMTLHVPAGKRQAYQSHWLWGSGFNVVEN